MAQKVGDKWICDPCELKEDEKLEQKRSDATNGLRVLNDTDSGVKWANKQKDGGAE